MEANKIFKCVEISITIILRGMRKNMYTVHHF